MKSIFALLVLASLYAFPSHALVLVVHDCQTADEQFRILITDNQGIGPVRTHHLSAAVLDRNGDTVATFPVQSNENLPRSASFGRITYSDIKTQGHKFSLAFPSTNYRHISLMAHLDAGTLVKDENLSCK